MLVTIGAVRAPGRPKQTRNGRESGTGPALRAAWPEAVERLTDPRVRGRAREGQTREVLQKEDCPRPGGNPGGAGSCPSGRGRVSARGRQGMVRRDGCRLPGAADERTGERLGRKRSAQVSRRAPPSDCARARARVGGARRGTGKAPRSRI